jgi:hypothetical protein
MNYTFHHCFKFCLLFFFLTNFSNAQKGEWGSKERELSQHYAKILKYTGEQADSVSVYSTRFSKEFRALIATNPASIGYGFKSLTDSNYVRIITAADGNCRIYSWDNWTGGTMHFFEQIFQYKQDGKVFTKIINRKETDPGVYCSAIYSLAANNTAYYLVIQNGIYSSSDVSQSIQIFNIDKQQLIDTAKLFKTKTKLLNTIKVDYDFFSVVDRPERPVAVIKYDEKLKIIYIPVVNQKKQVTDKNFIYQFKDNYFEYTGVKKGYRQ